MIGFNWQFLFVLLIFLPALPAFAQEAATIELDTDKDVYQDGDYIKITGTVSKKAEPTALVGIYDPFGGPAGFYIAEIVDGKYFSVEFLAKAGVNFKVDGTYSASAFYAKTKQTITFDFVEKLEEPDPTENETSQEAGTTIPDTTEADTADDTTAESDTSVDQKNTITNDTADTTTDTTNTTTDDTHDQADTATNEIIPAEPDDVESDTTEVDTTVEQEVDNTTNTTPVDTKIITNPKPNKEEKNTTTKPNEIVETKEEKAVNKDYDNLSVEDIELGIMLNQINLNCDASDVKFDISYYDGMGPSLTRLCKFEQALSFYDKELVEEPEYVKVLSNKGVALSKLGYYDEALVHFDAALQVQPTFVSAINNKANVLYELGYVQEAHDLYQQVLEINPNHKLASKNLAYVDMYMAKPKAEAFSAPVANTENAESDSFEKETEQKKPADIFEQITSLFSGIAKSIFG